jgi:hypothetical protein
MKGLLSLMKGFCDERVVQRKGCPKKSMMKGLSKEINDERVIQRNQ